MNNEMITWKIVEKPLSPKVSLYRMTLLSFIIVIMVLGIEHTASDRAASPVIFETGYHYVTKLPRPGSDLKSSWLSFQMLQIFFEAHVMFKNLQNNALGQGPQPRNQATQQIEPSLVSCNIWLSLQTESTIRLRAWMWRNTAQQGHPAPHTLHLCPLCEWGTQMSYAPESLNQWHFLEVQPSGWKKHEEL